MNIINFDWPFDTDSPSLFCPACGVQVLKPMDAVEQPSCKHIQFLYIDEVGEFEYIAVDLEKQLKKLGEQQDLDDPPSDYELLQTILNDDPGTLVMELTTSGMACGPVSSTAFIGFQLFNSQE